MFIRIHSNSSEQDHALQVYSKILDVLGSNIVSERVKKVERYWKIDTIFITEAEIELSVNFTKDNQHKFLKELSQNWHIDEDDPLEGLTSKNMGEIFIEDIEMITISF